MIFDFRQFPGKKDAKPILVFEQTRVGFHYGHPGIFALSTYNTDYILVKEDNFERALAVLADEGYIIEE